MSRRTLWLLATWIALGAALPAAAGDRLVRHLDASDGLPSTVINGLAQDETGYIWIATDGGLVRWDGRDVRVWTSRSAVLAPGSGPADEIYFYDPDGALWRVEGDGVSAVALPEGRSGKVVGAYRSDDGALWVQAGERLLRRDRQGAWSTIAGTFRSPFSAGAARVIHPGLGGTLLVAEDEPEPRLVRLAADGTRESLAATGGWAMAALELPDQRVLCMVADEKARLLDVHEGRVRTLYERAARPIAIAVRRDALWLTFDSGLVVLRPGREPEELSLPSEYLLIDRDESVWTSHVRGVTFLPEPDSTASYPDPPGLPRALLASQGALWMATWSGVFRVDPNAAVPRFEKLPHAHISPVCADSRDALWYAVQDAFVEQAPDGSVVRHPEPGLLFNHRCSAAADGGLWIPAMQALYHLAPGSIAPRRVALSLSVPTVREDVVWRVYETEDNLLLGIESTLCRAPARDVAEGRVADWRCTVVERADRFEGTWRAPSGAFWIGTAHAGVWRERGAGIASPEGPELEPIPGSRSLPASGVAMIRPSRDGRTLWVVTRAGVFRVAERLDLPEGWKVEERLGAWQGTLDRVSHDLWESERGDVFIAGLSLMHIPREARHVRARPPRVALVDVAVDGTRVPRDRTLELPFRRNRLELAFAAMSYRDPTLLRYRMRMLDDEAWGEPTANADVRFVDLAPGRYAVSVEASLDGRSWSDAPARFEFFVGRPFYLQSWFLGGAALVVATLLALAYRVRVAALLRLERQRARIARDLHDELGAGLGGIGIMAGLAARADLDETRRADLAERIAAHSADLGDALTDIVWSLRPGATRLRSLVAHLADRGSAMFADGVPRFEVTAAADLPDLPLSLAARRNAVLIGLEALHNAKRHAGAGRVVLEIAVVGRRIRLSVSDDGRGMPAAFDRTAAEPALRSGGTGIAGMRARAEEIGAELRLESDSAGGTVMVLDFPAMRRSRGGGGGA